MKKLFIAACGALAAIAQPQTITSPDYFVETAASGLSLSISFVFLGPNDMLIAEKNTGRIKHYENGAFVNTPLDLPVNNASERGLLGITLHPNFASNGFVYVYYSRAAADGGTWLDNRVERYVWNGTTLAFNALIFNVPTDGGQSNGPNHNGGIIKFGPDGKLYIITGDLNRDRIEQNANTGTSSGVGGVHRLNDDGTIPADNPFIANPIVGLRSFYAYGMRNSFGLAFDPLTGSLWQTENGPSSYDEINLVSRGMNGGWKDIMGPDSRDPQNISDLVMIPGATYVDPKFSWLTPPAVTGISFLTSDKFLPNERNAMLVGDNNNGFLYLFKMNDARDDLVLTGGLADRVADNNAERDQNLFGMGWAVATDMQIGPDGYMYVCSLGLGEILRIRPKVETVLPGAFTLLRGNLLSGNLASTHFSDDDRFSMQNGIAFDSNPPVRLEVRGTAPIDNPVELRFQLEAQASSTSLLQRVELFNYDSGVFESVDARQSTLADSTFEVVVTTNPGRFIDDTTKQMRAQMSWKANAPLFAFTWTARVDLANWKVKLQ